MAPNIKKINRLLVANRGEIAIRIFRAATELQIQTIAVYTFADRYSLHRYKADEAYQIGSDEEPLKPYLDIDEIISIAKRNNADAIHPGYGFLSENIEFATRCQAEGIIFVGPSISVMEQLGDKIKAKIQARFVDLPVIEDSLIDLSSPEIGLKEATRIGFPVLIKAAGGGGGRGMRIVNSKSELDAALREAQREAERAFGNSKVFLEKYIENPKHVEVQILGDQYGNVVHLYERDSSVQRRFQKVIEIAPAIGLSNTTRNSLFAAALKLAKKVSYYNAGTIEFLVDQAENIYFIEVNPRIQVEHTVTEEVTGIDLVRAQLLIAQGYPLSDPLINIDSQDSIELQGAAIQCRITTENPRNNFSPDYGKLLAYRSPGGYGIRLDAGSAYAGAEISPFFDSMLVKITTRGRNLDGAANRLSRALKEFRIRGVQTNIPFLLNVINNETFRTGQARVSFIADHPDLLKFKQGRDRATKVCHYLAEVVVNGHPDIKDKYKPVIHSKAQVPRYNKYLPPPSGSKQRLENLGREKFITELLANKQIEYTDTTFRDAHQSLLATRVRTTDLLAVAGSFAQHHPEIFSMEVWGGATFDVTMRFLHECPWERLKLLRAAIPNILFQMLLRGSNAVGYSAYPDNLIQSFIVKTWENGIDIFRIFDSMNWLPAMELSIKTVCQETSALAEASLCYTGDILNPDEKKFTLQYYLDLAKRLEDLGAHIIAVKDMAGLLKPAAATELISKLKETVKVPIHLHTHDTSGLQTATYLNAINVGVDIIDVALASMSGLTSQPNFNSIVAVLNGHPRQKDIDLNSLNSFSDYWEIVREYYTPFESGLKASTGEIYQHEIPGGQYSNLRPQARALGLEDRFVEIKTNYKTVNKMLGNIIKVTPSSKVVGDLALYMTSNNLSEADIFEKGQSLSFPESLVSFFRGDLGQPYQGFPKKLQEIVLKGEKPYTCRPNENLTPIDFESELKLFKEQFGLLVSDLDFLSYKLYPKVFKEFHEFQKYFGRVASIPTLAFFYGLEIGQEILVEIDAGKILIVSLSYVGDPNEEGMRPVHFNLNGQPREILVKDNSLKIVTEKHLKVSETNHVGSPLQGKLSSLLISEDQKVTIGTPLFVVEAMKMETIVSAPNNGTVKRIYLLEGVMLEQDDLVIELE